MRRFTVGSLILLEQKQSICTDVDDAVAKICNNIFLLWTNQ
jgi:hypothetical protein